jgi:uncharacterized protein
MMAGELGLRRTPPLWAWSVWRVLLFVILFAAFAIGLALVLWPVQQQAGTHAGILLETGVTAIAAVVAGLLLLRWCDRRPALALGFGLTHRTTTELGVGFLIGGGALVAAALLMVATGVLRYAPADGTIADVALVLGRDLGVLGLAAAAEEAVFRGYPFQVLVQWLGAVAATVLTSAAFAAAHLANPNVGAIGLLNIFLAGIMLSVAYLRTRSLWFATAVHVGWNWTMASAFDLPVSGLDLFETPLYDARIGGPAWLSGGAFGPEGGIIGTIAFGTALLVLLRWRVVRPAPEVVAARPLVEPESDTGTG